MYLKKGDHDIHLNAWLIASRVTIGLAPMSFLGDLSLLSLAITKLYLDKHDGLRWGALISWLLLELSSWWDRLIDLPLHLCLAFSSSYWTCAHNSFISRSLSFKYNSLGLYETDRSPLDDVAYVDTSFCISYDLGFCSPLMTLLWGPRMIWGPILWILTWGIIYGKSKLIFGRINLCLKKKGCKKPLVCVCIHA